MACDVAVHIDSRVRAVRRGRTHADIKLAPCMAPRRVVTRWTAAPPRHGGNVVTVLAIFILHDDDNGGGERRALSLRATRTNAPHLRRPPVVARLLGVPQSPSSLTVVPSAENRRETFYSVANQLLAVLLGAPRCFI